MRSRALSGGTVVFIKHYPHERKQRRKRRGFVRIVLESRGRGKRRGAGVRKRGQGYGETWNVAVSQPFLVERKRKGIRQNQRHGGDKTTCRRNCEKATGTGGNKKRRKTNAHAPRTSPSVHCAARHGVLLSRLFWKMARHSQRRKAFAIRAGLCRESYNGVDQEADRRKSVMPGHERRVIAKTSARAANVANFMVAKWIFHGFISLFMGSPKKHMACRKKHKALILK